MGGDQELPGLHPVPSEPDGFSQGQRGGGVGCLRRLLERSPAALDVVLATGLVDLVSGCRHGGFVGLGEGHMLHIAEHVPDMGRGVFVLVSHHGGVLVLGGADADPTYTALGLAYRMTTSGRGLCLCALDLS